MAEKVDLIKEFAAELDEAAGTERPEDKLTIEELRDLDRRMGGVLKEVKLIKLSKSVRKKMAGKRPMELQELMERLAQVVRKRPDCAEETHVTPEFCGLLAEMGLAVRGLVVTASDVMQSAGDRAHVAGYSTTETCLRVGKQARSFVADAQAPVEQRGDTRASFGAVLHLEAEQDRREKASDKRGEGKTAPLKAELKQKLDTAEAVRRLDRFLEAVKTEDPGFGLARPEGGGRSRLH